MIKNLLQSYGYSIIEKNKLSEMLAKSGKITNQIFFEDFFCCLGNYAYLCSAMEWKPSGNAVCRSSI